MLLLPLAFTIVIISYFTIGTVIVVGAGTEVVVSNIPSIYCYYYLSAVDYKEGT